MAYFDNKITHRSIKIMHPHDSSLLPGLIRKLSWELFDEAYSAKFKKARPIQDIYTVISSISLVDKQMNTFEVVVVGFGTKSLPYELIRQHHGHLIADMHAEMLAIRGFRRYLMLALREEETR